MKFCAPRASGTPPAGSTLAGRGPTLHGDSRGQTWEGAGQRRARVQVRQRRKRKRPGRRAAPSRGARRSATPAEGARELERGGGGLSGLPGSPAAAVCWENKSLQAQIHLARGRQSDRAQTPFLPGILSEAQFIPGGILAGGLFPSWPPCPFAVRPGVLGQRRCSRLTLTLFGQTVLGRVNTRNNLYLRICSPAPQAPHPVWGPAWGLNSLPGDQDLS